MPGTMNFRVVDAMLSVTDKQCFDMCLRLSREEGLLTGGSSGLNMHAAVELSGRCNPGAVIVVVLPDSGIKYLSKIYSPEWRQSNGFEDDPVADDTTNGTNGTSSNGTDGTSTPARTPTPDPQQQNNVERVAEALGMPKVVSALSMDEDATSPRLVSDIESSSQNLELLIDAQIEDVADGLEGSSEDREGER